jgi:hypothetical protein
VLGERARPMFDGLPIDTMAERLRMRVLETRRIGDDVRLLLQPGGGGLQPQASDEVAPGAEALVVP